MAQDGQTPPPHSPGCTLSSSHTSHAHQQASLVSSRPHVNTCLLRTPNATCRNVTYCLLLCLLVVFYPSPKHSSHSTHSPLGFSSSHGTCSSQLVRLCGHLPPACSQAYSSRVRHHHALLLQPYCIGESFDYDGCFREPEATTQPHCHSLPPQHSPTVSFQRAASAPPRPADLTHMPTLIQHLDDLQDNEVTMK